MGIVISERFAAGRELEINLNTYPNRFNISGLHSKEELAAYKGPLGDVYYRDGEDCASTPTALVDFENLDESVREELTKIEKEGRKLMERAKELLAPQLAASVT